MSPGDLVYDPFVGSGSIALACSYFGAQVLGSDLDQRVLRGFGVGRKTYNKTVSKQMEQESEQQERFNIFTNFKHYGLPLPNIFGQDVLKPMLRGSAKLDAIVCDPPYGLRARSRGFKEDTSSNDFSVSTIYAALLQLGVDHLRVGGRLVFLFHTDESVEAERNLFPEHPAFDFVSASQNELTKHRVRHLITLEKK